MKRAAVLLFALLITISLVSCRPSDGGGASSPVSGDMPPASVPDTSSDEKPSSSDSSSDEPENSSSAPSSSDASSSVTSSDEKPTVPPTETPDPEPLFKPLSAEEYHNYKNLNALQKSAYNKMYEAVLTMPGGYIELGDATLLSEGDVYLTAIALKNDRPEIFWLPYAWYIGETHEGQMAILFANLAGDENGDIESYEATYVVGRADRDRMAAELLAAVAEIKSGVTATDPYEIELQLHDILADRITYKSTTLDTLDYTAYGALVRGEAVCEGYARAMQLLLYEYGINSTLVTGFAGEPHMWNLVSLSDKWYHLDLTWNDRDDAIRHTYFNLTDAAISRDHILNGDFYGHSADDILGGEPFNYMLPVAADTENCYFVKTGFTFENNPEELAEKILAADFSQIEVKGFTESAKTQLEAALTNLGINKNLNYKTEGDWVLITLAQENFGG